MIRPSTLGSRKSFRNSSLETRTNFWVSLMAIRADLEIRSTLVRYLNSEISLAEFEDWFVPVAWNVEKTGNREAPELAAEIELRLAEFSNGHWSEPELRKILAPLVGVYETELSEEVAHVDCGYSLRDSSLDLRECSFQL